MNVYAYTVYVKQRAESSMLGICPGIAGQRVSWSGGQLVYKKCSLSSLLTGQNGRKIHILVGTMFYLIDSVHLSCTCA
jgi:hypothetical protein